GDDAGIGQRIAAVEYHRRVVDDVAGNAARGATVADVQPPGADSCGARIGVGTGEDRSARAVLLKRSGTRNDVAEGEGVGAVNREIGSASCSDGVAAGGGDVAYVKSPGCDGRAASAGLGAGHDQGAR